MTGEKPDPHAANATQVTAFVSPPDEQTSDDQQRLGRPELVRPLEATTQVLIAEFTDVPGPVTEEMLTRPRLGRPDRTPPPS